MGRLFDSPFAIILILVVILLLFGGPKLPGMARSLGQSMRIFKSEVKEMKRDDQGSNVTVDGQPVSDGEHIARAQRPTGTAGAGDNREGTAPPPAGSQPEPEPDSRPGA